MSNYYGQSDPFQIYHGPPKQVGGFPQPMPPIHQPPIDPFTPPSWQPGSRSYGNPQPSQINPFSSQIPPLFQSPDPLTPPPMWQPPMWQPGSRSYGTDIPPAFQNGQKPYTSFLGGQQHTDPYNMGGNV